MAFAGSKLSGFLLLEVISKEKGKQFMRFSSSYYYSLIFCFGK